jgi:hypothetical protein
MKSAAKHFLYFLILLIVLVGGCTSETQSITTQLPDYEPSAILRVIPTGTSEIDRFTKTMEPTPISSTNQSRLASHCVKLLDQIPENVDMSGVLVFSDTLLNLESGDETQFRNDWRWGSKRVSPDREKIALALENNTLKILNAAGGEIAEIVIPNDEPLSLAYWLNSDTIVFGNNVIAPSSFLLDIKSGDLFEIPGDTFPDFEPWTEWIGASWYPFGYTTRSSISPDGHYIVYATYTPGSNQIVLWDLENDVEVARFDGRYDSTFPVWSPDSQYFLTLLEWKPVAGKKNLAIESGNELVRISTSGKVERLTYLTDTENIVSEYFHVLSPDGEQVAFWLGSGLPLGIHQLAILDIASGVVTNYCLKGTEPPVWSPDGHYLAVMAANSSDLVNQVYIVDIENKMAYLVKDRESDLNGWMVYDQEAIGENVYISPPETAMDVQLAELRASFEDAQPSGEFFITDDDFENIVDQTWDYLNTQIDPSLYTFESKVIEEPDTEYQRGIWKDLGIYKEYTIHIANKDFCAIDGILDEGFFRITEYETSLSALRGGDGLISMLETDRFTKSNPEIEKIPYGDWGLFLITDTNDLCASKTIYKTYNQISISIGNYSVTMNFLFVKDTVREYQREILLSLVEIIENNLQQMRAQ